MSRGPRASRVLALFAALACALAPAAPAAAPRDSLAAPSLRPTRADAAFALATAGVVTWAATRDRNLSGVVRASDTRFALDLAATAKRMGDPYVVAPALLAVDGVARLARRPALGAATERIALSMVAAGAVSGAIKRLAGRERPDESPDDASRLHFLANHDAFPSGHTVVAFSLAAAIDAETRARWVPWLAYPAAGVTAWSRVRDGRHWPSDVVAGAAIGGWTARKVDRWAQHRLPDGLLVLAWPSARGGRVVMGARF